MLHLLAPLPDRSHEAFSCMEAGKSSWNSDSLFPCDEFPQGQKDSGILLDQIAICFQKGKKIHHQIIRLLQLLRSVGYYQDTVQLTAVCIDLAGLKNSVRSQVKSSGISRFSGIPCPGSVHDTEDPPKNIRSISGSALSRSSSFTRYKLWLSILSSRYGFILFLFKHITDLADQIPEAFPLHGSDIQYHPHNNASVFPRLP